MQAITVRRVPWTCRWGRFGGPVPVQTVYRATFWSCLHPSRPTESPWVDEPICEACACWAQRPESTAGNPAPESPLGRPPESPDG
jgi:hypothetical protein